MPTLHPAQRGHLEKTVVAARDESEKAALNALKRLAVDQDKPFEALGEADRALRVRLRAEMRRLGGLDALVAECAYEQWHRMLFARFLAENDLLIHPDTLGPVTLHDCLELAQYEGDADAWACAARYASRMLPAIFRSHDPILEVRFDALGRQTLERLLSELPVPIFTADDSIGWVYQFWQSKRKQEVNASGEKIGGADISPVTQLFTEHYMVEFLLHNSLGAWWAARHPDSPLNASLSYLRLSDDGAPAAGNFSGWPSRAAELKVLDPCCGSGHFDVAAFELLRQMRMSEEGLTAAQAGNAVLRDNLFGLELDPRCTQIAAFAVAMAAWKSGGYRTLPQINIACSGLAVGDRLHEWTSLAGRDQQLEATLRRLYRLFRDAPDLGSLIDPAKVIAEDGLYALDLADVGPVLGHILARERDGEAHVFGVAAQGVARAAELLTRKYHLVVTNVPYLAIRKQEKVLFDYLAERHNEARFDLATAFVERCLAFCTSGGSTALVTPQNWLFLGSYKKLRERLLREKTWDALARLGPGAFETITGEVVNVILLTLTNRRRPENQNFLAIDASTPRVPSEKSDLLRCGLIHSVSQEAQMNNPDARIALDEEGGKALLEKYADGLIGLMNGDSPHFQRLFWEIPERLDKWHFQQSTVETTMFFGGCETIIFYDKKNGHLRESAEIRRKQLHDSDRRGRLGWGKQGVAVSSMGNLPVAIYTGELLDNNTALILPRDPAHLPAIWAFCSSPDFHKAVRRIDQALKVTNASLVKVPFDLAHWQKVADEQYPNGLPEPHSDDPTQWLFTGHPNGSTAPLQVAVARLLGYRWPQNADDDLAPFADDDGIVCLPPVAGEAPAAERLRSLLAHAYGEGWSPAVQDKLLADAGSAGKDLDEWLRDGFFAQHCKMFGQRPLLWHIWDGRKDGFAALVNYHGLDRAKLDKLIYTYLGGWIKTQQDAVRQGIAGSDGRLVAAQTLQKKLIAIAEGEAAEDRKSGYDVYVRWKPLAKQPIGWDPDINDGVRINIRPFMAADVLRARPNINWNKDRGKNPDGSDRLNDLHKTRAEKEAARAERRVGMNHTFPPLQALLGGETLSIEYKQDNNQRHQGDVYPDEAIAEALMSISNAEGGYILLGVDNKGNVTGLNPRRRERPHVLMNRLGRKFMRTPMMASHEYQEGGQRVYAFYIEAAQPPPHQLQSGILKIRKDMGGKQGPENVPFPIGEMAQWEAQRGVHTDFSSKLLRELPWRDHEKFLNPLAIGIFQRRIREGQINNPSLHSLDGLEQQMDALGLIGTVDGQRVLTNAAVILFGSNDVLHQYVPNHAAQFQAFAPDGSLPVSLFTGKPGFEHFCLLYLAERIIELFRGVVLRGEMMDGPYRIDIPAYGDDALREATMNAFIHRDYTATEAVIIQVTTDHFTITNAGGFYRDVKPDNILFHEPCPRNKCLAQACTDLGLMEKSGRGVDRIFWDQIRFLRPMPSYSASTSDTVRLTLLGGRGSLEDIHWMTEYFSAEDDLLTRVIKGSLMHALIVDGEATREELIAALPGLSPILGRKTITELIDAGLMQRVGHGRGQQIVLSAKFQRDRGKPEAFIHQAGVDVEARPVVMEYVETYGSITRGEAASLLNRPADDSLYRLLKRMVDDGLLVPQGERAATRYVKP